MKLSVLSHQKQNTNQTKVTSCVCVCVCLCLCLCLQLVAFSVRALRAPSTPLATRCRRLLPSSGWLQSSNTVGHWLLAWWALQCKGKHVCIIGKIAPIQWMVAIIQYMTYAFATMLQISRWQVLNSQTCASVAHINSWHLHYRNYNSCIFKYDVNFKRLLKLPKMYNVKGFLILCFLGSKKC